MNEFTYEQLEQRVKELENLHDEYESIQQSLKTAQQRLDLSLSAGNLAWWEFDIPTGRVTYNENKVRVLGYAPKDFPNPCVYTDFTDLIHPDDHENTMNAMRDHLAGKKDLYETEYRIRTVSGDYRWFYDRGSITSRDKEGKPLTLKGIVFDITDKKEQEKALMESEQALREANTTKDKLFSIISHDLRSSIGNLVNFLKYMIEDPEMFSKDEFQQIIRSLHESSLTTFEMLENLLAWARNQSNTLEYRPQQVHLSSVFSQITGKLAAVARQKNISLLTDALSTLTCTADINMLIISVRNIITNAIKFTPRGGRVQMTAYAENEKVVIEIRDSGIGMKKEKLESLFSLGALSSSAGTDGEKGSGLGLILCKELIERQKGSLSVTSVEGEGSCFLIRLPK